LKYYTVLRQSPAVDLMDGSTTIAGIAIPSTSPWFLVVVGIHIVLGLACVVSGAAAMLSTKRRGRHSTAGTIYFWCLFVIFITATALSLARWSEDKELFFLGALSFAAALVGRRSARRGGAGWATIHVSGMGLSYIVLLTAFYVDNGKSLPVWKDFSPLVYWLAPAVVGLPLMIHALLHHPVVVASRRSRRDGGAPA
jgi:hypothetical protein